jgi:hypothetical protein
MVLITIVIINRRRDVVFTLTMVTTFLMIGLHHSSSLKIVIAVVGGAIGLLFFLGMMKRPARLSFHSDQRNSD